MGLSDSDDLRTTAIKEPHKMSWGGTEWLRRRKCTNSPTHRKVNDKTTYSPTLQRATKDAQPDRHAHKQASRQKQTRRQTSKRTNRQADTHTNRQGDENRQAEKRTNRQADKHPVRGSITRYVMTIDFLAQMCVSRRKNIDNFYKVNNLGSLMLLTICSS